MIDQDHAPPGAAGAGLPIGTLGSESFVDSAGVGSGWSLALIRRGPVRYLPPNRAVQGGCGTAHGRGGPPGPANEGPGSGPPLGGRERGR